MQVFSIIADCLSICALGYSIWRISYLEKQLRACQEKEERDGKNV